MCDITRFMLAPPATMRAALAERLPAFAQVDWVEQTGSTNTDLLAQARQGNGARARLLGAHSQQSGHGRAGRPWRAQVGHTLLFSCAFDINLSPASLPMLSPLAGLLACEALRELAPDATLDLKWPNDVQRDGAKLAGILVESTRSRTGRQVVVIGMGLNLSGAADLSQTLERAVADWQDLPGDPIDIVAQCAHAWQRTLEPLTGEDFTPFVARYAAVDALLGRTVRVIDRGTVLREACAAGLDVQGRLLIRDAQGQLSPVSVGEISVRAQP